MTFYSLRRLGDGERAVVKTESSLEERDHVTTVKEEIGGGVGGEAREIIPKEFSHARRQTLSNKNTPMWACFEKCMIFDLREINCTENAGDCFYCRRKKTITDISICFLI